MTIDDKLKYIKTHCFELDACRECKLTVGKTCPTKLWGEWTDEEIETAYAILHGEVDPDGEEKCGLLNGEGITRAEKYAAIAEYCKNRGMCKDAPICPLVDCGCNDDRRIDNNYSILVNAGLIKPSVNFTKANPDDEVESGDDHIVEVNKMVGTLADSGTRREFDSGAVRDMAEGKGRCDLLPAVAILRLAKHFERGAVKYSDRNWEKGIPIHSFIDSAIRHTLKYLDGQHDEDHLCAAAWNLICAMWTEEKHPELNDLPWAKGE